MVVIKIINWDDYHDKIYAEEPHEVSELMCMRCFYRYIGVYHIDSLLKDMHCPACNETGYIIKTGQSLQDKFTGKEEINYEKNFQGKRK